MKLIKYYIGIIIVLSGSLQTLGQPPVTCQSSTLFDNGSFENTTCTAPTSSDPNYPCTGFDYTTNFTYGCIDNWEASHGSPFTTSDARTGNLAALLYANGTTGQGIYQKYFISTHASKRVQFYAKRQRNWLDVHNTKGTLYVYYANGLSPVSNCNPVYANKPFISGNSNLKLLWTIDLSTLSTTSYTHFTQRINSYQVGWDYCYLWFYLEGDTNPNEQVGVSIDDVNVSTAGCMLNYPIDAPSTLPNCNVSSVFKFSASSFHPYNNGATNIIWDFGDGNFSTDFNPTHTYASPGTYTVKVTGNDIAKCRFESTKTITVLNTQGNSILGLSGAGGGSKYLCEDFTFGYSFTPSTNIAAETVSSLTWDFGDGNSITVQSPAANYTVNHKYNTTGTKTVTLTADLSNGCTKSVSIPVNVTDPTLNINANLSYYECEVVNPTYSTSGVNPTSVLWKINDASGAQSTSHTPSFTYAEDGTYTLELEADYGNGCVLTASKQISILDRALSINANSTAKECENINFNYSNLGTTPTFVKWEFGDAANTISFDNSPNFSYDLAGTYTVTLTATWGSCQIQTTKQITINDRGLSINMPSLTCHTTNNTFSFTPIDADITSQSWNFGDNSPTSSLQSPTHQYAKGNYTVTLTVEYANGCTVSESGAITVEDPTVTINTTPNTTEICKDDFMTFDFNYSNLSATAPLSWTWDFGDGSPTSSASSPSHQYTSGGAKTVTLTVDFSSGCTEVRTKVINVDAPTISMVLNSDEGCLNTPITMPSFFLIFSYFNNTPTNLAWNFGDGSPIVNTSYGAPPPSHSYTSTGTKTVRLTATFPGGCTAFSEDDILIKDYITKTIAIEGPDQVCIGNPIQFDLDGDLGGATFSWDFANGQGSSAESPVTYYTTAGTYTVTVTATYSENCVTQNPLTAVKTVDVDDYDYCSSCEECIGSFSPVAGEKYVLSAWVKEEDSELSLSTYNAPRIAFFYEGDNSYSDYFKAKGPIIEGWQRIEEVFVIPETTSAIRIELVNQGGQDVFFDDIRIYPFNGNLKSFVYDPISMQLTAELDENNYATFYEYDEDGNLIRVKKETERGIKTIQETVKRTKQE